MRTKFFSLLFILLATVATAQNQKKANRNGKPSAPDMSVLGNDPASNQIGAAGTDTLNSLPNPKYGRVSAGLNFGSSFYSGDVPADIFSRTAFGGYIKYSFSHIFGVRLQYLQGDISGGTYKVNDNFYNAFQTSISNVNLQGILNLGGIDFRKSYPRNNFYFGFGISRQAFNGKRDTPDSLNNIQTVNESIMTIPLTLGYKRKINKNFDIGAEFTYNLGGNDKLDLTEIAGTPPDANGYFMASLVYNITTPKRAVHIDWTNPIDLIYRELNKNKDHSESLKADADQDGVPDYLDKEPNTPKGFKVDANGVTLDSDNDGIPDSEDPDPFGFEKALGLYFPAGSGGGGGGTGGNGMDSSERLYRLNDSVPSMDFATISRSGYGLPTIIFPPNRFTVHVEQYNILHQIAKILLVDTSASLVIIGHADSNQPNFTQLTLAEKRALEVKRKLRKVFEINETRMLVYSSRDPYVKKFQMATEGLDRKVEFRIIRPVQKRQPRIDSEELNKRN